MRFVSRSEWGARPPRQVSRNIQPASTTAHYGGDTVWGGVVGGHDRCAAVVRGWQAFHMDGRGWSDIAYSAVCCPHGFVFEGRGIGVRSAANGTDAGNRASYAVCYLGGVGDPLTDAGKQAMLDAAAWLGQPLTRVHSDWFPTSCPGDEIRAWVRAGAPAPTSQAPGGVEAMTPEQRNEVVGRLDRALGLLEAIHPAMAAVHVGVMDPTSGVRTMVAQLLARQPGGTDPKAVAKAVAEALPTDIARLVADELARRLRD